MSHTGRHLTQGAGPPAPVQGAGPAQGARPPVQVAGPPSARRRTTGARGRTTNGARSWTTVGARSRTTGKGAGPPAHGAGPSMQGVGPPMQGVRPLVPNTIPQLDGAEPEPKLGAEPDVKVPSDPEPAQLKDPGLEVVSCVCSSYNICLESVSCPMASRRRENSLFCNCVICKFKQGEIQTKA